MSTTNLSSTALSSLFSDLALGESRGTLAVGRSAAAGSTTAVPGTSGEADAAKVSELGQALSQLQQLSGTDEDAFKTMAQSIADNLAQSAKDSDDAQEKDAWTALSSQFAQAAQSGGMASLLSMVSVTAGLAGATATDGADTVSLSDEGKALAALGETSGLAAGAKTVGGSDSAGADSSGSGSLGSSDSDTSDSSGTSDSAGSGSSDSGSSDSGSSDSGSSGSASASADSTSTEAASGGAASSGSASGGTSSSGKTLDEIEDEIDEKERDIKAAQGKLDSAKQAATLGGKDESKGGAQGVRSEDGGEESAEVKSRQSTLDSLNMELAVLQSEKLQAQ